LAAVPLDPFTGKPLLFKTREDGVTVYSVGRDGVDDGGLARNPIPLKPAAKDIGFRLYNPDQRRLTSLPQNLDEPKWELGPEPRVVIGPD
jgi:hypothetical protein